MEDLNYTCACGQLVPAERGPICPYCQQQLPTVWTNVNGILVCIFRVDENNACLMSDEKTHIIEISKLEGPVQEGLKVKADSLNNDSTRSKILLGLQIIAAAAAALCVSACLAILGVRNSQVTLALVVIAVMLVGFRYDRKSKWDKWLNKGDR